MISSFLMNRGLLHRSRPWITVLVVLLFSPVIRAGPVRNVILCIGDGMGPEQVKAARLYAGTNLFFETLPYQSTLTTGSADSSITDSAAAATAMATGFKVNLGVISLQLPGDGHELETLLEYFKKRDKSTGLVATSILTDATPAAFAAHETSRENTTAIASDYLTQTRPNVLLGGGGSGMTISNALTAGYTVVTNTTELFGLAEGQADHLCGQFGSTYMPYEYDGLGHLPHLHEMTQVALNILDNDPDGFFLMVEGSRIDHAGHVNDLPRCIAEVLEFAETVETIVDWIGDREDTLLLVTADHETGGLVVTNDNGAGNYPSVTWSTNYHTATPVPLYGTGLNAHLVTNLTDNTEIHALSTAAALVPERCLSTFTAPTGVHMQWTASSGDIYRIEYSTDLSPANWQPLNSYTATTTRLSVSTEQATTSAFYRAISLGTAHP